jgi:hypothetical protein
LVLVFYLTGVSFVLGTFRPLGYMHAPNLGVRGSFVCVLGIFGVGLGYGCVMCGGSLWVEGWIVLVLLVVFFWVVPVLSLTLG